MVNMYAYTYENAIKSFAERGHILVKIGDSHRNVDVRMSEQGGAAEYEEKIKIGQWDNLKTIDRDYRVHEVLTLGVCATLVTHVARNGLKFLPPILARHSTTLIPLSLILKAAR